MSNDSKGYLATLGGVQADFLFVGPGQFTARVTQAKLPHMYLIGVEESMARIARISLSLERTFAVFSTEAEPAQFCDGVKLGPWDVMLLHGRNGAVYQRMNRPSNWGLISVEPEVFVMHWMALMGSRSTPERQRSILRPSWSAAARLRQLHKKICELVETTPDIVTHIEIARALENDVLHALVNCLGGETVDGHLSTRQRHAEIIDQFEHVLATDLTQRLTVTDLCAKVGVPERTLRACCAEVLGMSPSRFLRLRRLNLVRATLQCKPAPSRVGELARRYGFSQPGRFATWYREAFGETPSSTLRRCHRNNGTDENTSLRPHDLER
jgi:AraC-like DNA-binding protein